MNHGHRQARLQPGRIAAHVEIARRVADAFGIELISVTSRDAELHLGNPA